MQSYLSDDSQRDGQEILVESLYVAFLILVFPPAESRLVNDKSFYNTRFRPLIWDIRLLKNAIDMFIYGFEGSKFRKEAFNVLSGLLSRVTVILGRFQVAAESCSDINIGPDTDRKWLRRFKL